MPTATTALPTSSLRPLRATAAGKSTIHQHHPSSRWLDTDNCAAVSTSTPGGIYKYKQCVLTWPAQLTTWVNEAGRRQWNIFILMGKPLHHHQTSPNPTPSLLPSLHPKTMGLAIRMFDRGDYSPPRWRREGERSDCARYRGGKGIDERTDALTDGTAPTAPRGQTKGNRGEGGEEHGRPRHPSGERDLVLGEGSAALGTLAQGAGNARRGRPRGLADRVALGPIGVGL